jgi:predicted neutral ceramidase superfamily lipid hydrolase
VFGNPWDSEADMFACCVAVSFIDPLLLWCGGELTSAIFGFSSRWPLGIFMAAALVGAAGFITIVGRERTSLSVDALAIAAWVLLGLVVAPVLGLALPTGAAIGSYAVLLLAILVYVLRFGRWQTAFLRTLSWPVTWSLLALFFAFSAHRLILYQ